MIIFKPKYNKIKSKKCVSSNLTFGNKTSKLNKENKLFLKSLGLKLRE